MNSLGKNYFPWIIGGLVVVGALVTFFVVQTVAQSERESLSERATTIAATLPTQFLNELPGTAEDINIPIYQDLKATLTRIREANKDVRFVYVLGQKGEDIFFYADSEDPTSEDYSAPGDVYYEASDALKQSFVEGKPFVEGPTPDRWGVWVSGITPIRDPQSGEIRAAVGMDVSARSYYQAIAVNAVIPILLTLIAILIVWAGYRVERKEDELFRLKFRFLSIASHELRSPLSGIQWGSEYVLSHAGDTLQAKEKEMVSLIRDASTYMLGTVNDILDASRFEANVKNTLLREEVDIATLVRETAKTLSFNANEDRVTVSFDSAFPEHCRIMGDREKLRRIFSNVISNALKYSKPNTTVTVSLEKTSEGCLVTVVDQGIGIPQSEQDKIFKTYYRATNAVKAVSQGTGLGLFFTKQLVELHGGRLWFESEENKGTTMHVLLPEGNPVV